MLKAPATYVASSRVVTIRVTFGSSNFDDWGFSHFRQQAPETFDLQAQRWSASNIHDRSPEWSRAPRLCSNRYGPRCSLPNQSADCPASACLVQPLSTSISPSRIAMFAISCRREEVTRLRSIPRCNEVGGKSGLSRSNCHCQVLPEDLAIDALSVARTLARNRGRYHASE